MPIACVDQTLGNGVKGEVSSPGLSLVVGGGGGNNLKYSYVGYSVLLFSCYSALYCVIWPEIVYSKISDLTAAQMNDILCAVHLSLRGLIVSPQNYQA